MRIQKLTRIRDQKVFANSCCITESFWERLCGLMGREALPEGTGLWIEPCNSIHTFFMKFPIDVVYLDRHGLVLKIHQNVKPWRMDLPVFKARSVLELPCGGAFDLKNEDQLCLS
jgi:hypothetical protein